MMVIFVTAFCMSIVGLEGPKPEIDETRCGSYCLTVALKSFDSTVTLKSVELDLGEPTAAGYSLNQLEKTAKSLGMNTTVSLTSLDNLKWRKRRLGERFACITLIRNDHFVLLTDIKDSTVSICDPPRTDTLDIPVFDRIWSGNVLLVSDAPLKLEEDVVRSRNRWRFASIAGFGMTGGLVMAGLFLKFMHTKRQRDSK